MSNQWPVDDLDRAIIDELRRDGRLTNQALAQRVGLTPGPACAASGAWRSQG